MYVQVQYPRFTEFAKSFTRVGSTYSDGDDHALLSGKLHSRWLWKRGEDEQCNDTKKCERSGDEKEEDATEVSQLREDGGYEAWNLHRSPSRAKNWRS